MTMQKKDASRPVYWAGSITKCELCSAPLGRRIIDGRLSASGQWALTCPSCHTSYGVGLGMGRGQAYEKQPNGRYLKVAG